MKEILQNLALIHLNKFCMANQIDISGTKIEKGGPARSSGLTYFLYKDGEPLAGVTFGKSSVPLYRYFSDHPEWIAAEKRGIIEP